MAWDERVYIIVDISSSPKFKTTTSSRSSDAPRIGPFMCRVSPQPLLCRVGWTVNRGQSEYHGRWPCHLPPITYFLSFPFSLPTPPHTYTYLHLPNNYTFVPPLSTYKNTQKKKKIKYKIYKMLTRPIYTLLTALLLGATTAAPVAAPDAAFEELGDKFNDAAKSIEGVFQRDAAPKAEPAFEELGDKFNDAAKDIKNVFQRDAAPEAEPAFKELGDKFNDAAKDIKNVFQRDADAGIDEVGQKFSNAAEDVKDFFE